EDLAEIQPDQRMRIVDPLDAPGMDSADGQADFLVQLAPQRLLHAFAGFDLAARKLPVALVNLARRARCQQEGTVRTDQHAHGDFDFLAIRAAFAWTVAVGN